MAAPNLMWTLIALNLHHFTDSKAELNISKVSYPKSNNIVGPYQRRLGGDGKAMADRALANT